MPPAADRPIAQLVGGGPQPNSSTLIHITADRQQMQIKMSKLDGTVVTETQLPA